MLLLSIIFNDKKENVIRFADRVLKNYGNQDFNIDIQTRDGGKSKILEFNVEDSSIQKISRYDLEDLKNVFKHYASITMVDYIIEVYEIKLIEKIINNSYEFLKPLERKLVLEQLSILLEKEFNEKNITVTYKVNRKAKILYKLMGFLSNNDSVSIEGFVNFRLQNYIDDLSEMIDKAIEEYMMEKEYKEFIKLLKYFVNIQDPKIDLLNIVVDKEGKYHFYDENLKVIEDKYIRELVDDLLDKDISSDDLLISSLITIAPNKIIIHFSSNIRNSEIIETIKNIFEDKLYICNNCRICNLDRFLKEE